MELKSKNYLFIFNFLLLGFFSCCIISISAYTLFQVLIILFSIFELIFDFKFYKENVFNKDFFNRSSILSFVGYFLIFAGFIISFIFSTFPAHSLERLSIHAIIILSIPAGFLLFTKYKEKLKEIDIKYLIINLFIMLAIILANLVYIILKNGNFKNIFTTRQYGFLGNEIGFAYCMIIPMFFIIYNQYLIILKNKKIISLYTLIISILMLIIQVILLISSGSRTPFFAFLFTLIIIFFIYFFISKKTIFNKIVFFILILSIIVFFILIFFPNLNVNSLKNIQEKYWKYVTKKGFYSIYRMSSAIQTLRTMYDFFKNPSELVNSCTSESQRVSYILASIEIIKRRLLVGTGPYSWAFYIWNDEKLTSLFHPYFVGQTHTHTHNDILQILAEFGLIFFTGYIILMIISLINIIKIIKKKRFDGLFLLSIYLLLLIGGLTDYIFGYFLTGPCYGLFLGIFSSLGVRLANESND